MSETVGNSGATSNAIAQQWAILKDDFGGAPVSGNIENAQTMEAKLGASNANSMLEEAINEASKAQTEAQSATSKLAEIEAQASAYEQATVERSANIEANEASLKDNKANLRSVRADNKFASYVLSRAGLGAEVILAGGGVIASAVSKFVRSRSLPRIKFRSPIEISSNHTVANEKVEDKHNAVDEAWNAKDARLKREKAQEKEKQIDALGQALTNRKGSFQEALKAFHAKKAERQKNNQTIYELKKDIRVDKRSLATAGEKSTGEDASFEKYKAELAKAKQEAEAAEAALKAAQALADEKGNLARKKALELDRMQTLANFEAQLGTRSVAEWREKLSTRKAALSEGIELLGENASPEKLEEAKSRLETVERQLKALAVYEAEINGTAPAIPDEIVADVEPAATEPDAAESEEPTEPTADQAEPDEPAVAETEEPAAAETEEPAVAEATAEEPAAESEEPAAAEAEEPAAETEEPAAAETEEPVAAKAENTEAAAAKKPERKYRSYVTPNSLYWQIARMDEDAEKEKEKEERERAAGLRRVDTDIDELDDAA